MLELPAFQRLRVASRVLVAGAGGGFDIFSGLPLALALQRAGKHVELANLSFSSLDSAGIDWAHDDVAEVTCSSTILRYFPERHLVDWIAARTDLKPRIFCFRKSNGVVQMRAAYQHLVSELNIDAVVLVDGGSDSLMKGDEFGLGTPVEDMVSIAAAAPLDVSTKMLVSLGFGVDQYHGVCHAQVLRAVAELSRTDAYLGAHSLLTEMEEVKQYLDAVDYVQSRNGQKSIVSASIADAIRGRFGDHHSTQRTAGSTLFINPLMAIYWFFDLVPVAKRVGYLPALEGTRSWGEVKRAIREYRGTEATLRAWESIPL
jgi:hypothetical protein